MLLRTTDCGESGTVPLGTTLDALKGLIQQAFPQSTSESAQLRMFEDLECRGKTDWAADPRLLNKVKPFDGQRSSWLLLSLPNRGESICTVCRHPGACAAVDGDPDRSERVRRLLGRCLLP